MPLLRRHEALDQIEVALVERPQNVVPDIRTQPERLAEPGVTIVGPGRATTPLLYCSDGQHVAVASAESRMIENFQPAVPPGERLIGVAPLVGDWVPRGGRLPNFLLVFLLARPISVLVFLPFDDDSGTVANLQLALTVAIWIGVLVWYLRWRRRHPKPNNLASAMMSYGRSGLVVLVTASQVLVTVLSGTAKWRDGPRPAWQAQPIRGLLCVDSDGDDVIFGFEDHSVATLHPQHPKGSDVLKFVALAQDALEASDARIG